MLKEIFHDSFENFEITRIGMENQASVTGWQKLFFPTFGGRCNRYFWDIRVRLKILRFPIFNMPFQLVLTKFFKSELFSCLQKVDHVIKSCKETISRKLSLTITRMSKLVCFLGNRFQHLSVFVEWLVQHQGRISVFDQDVYTRIFWELLNVWLSLVQGKHILWPFLNT